MNRRVLQLLGPLCVLMLLLVLGGCGGDETSPTSTVQPVGAVTTTGTVSAASSGTQADRVLFEKMAAAWGENDAATAREIYAPDAVVRWTDGSASVTNSGIDDISAAVERFAVNFVPVADIQTYTVSGDQLPGLGPSYGDVHYVAAPVARQGQLYMAVIGISDGKIANQWVTPIYRY